MIDTGKRNVLGVLVDVIDYESAVRRILAAAQAREPLGVTALAVHGVMTGAMDPAHRRRLNELDIVTPDGQPVRWALNWLHRAHLRDRVYGPRLMLEVCAAAARESLPIFLFGSRADVLARLTENLADRFKGLLVVGAKPSAFRRLTPDERDRLAETIRDSGARIVFVGLGCPRQEVFVYEMRRLVKLPMIAVGAAFEFHAGFAREAPEWMQRAGLQWLHRLAQNPRRLWRRYVLLNPAYAVLVAAQATGLWCPEPFPHATPAEERYG
ncbi:MAG: WecB/TagA/CpsF family glycosyltransferase [Kiritimatiellae bacterium]|nr:WecB/TagA/CpsF family glycosyltransferase [Kiritimatiellia bacterium]MDW8457622.1 WecB/TagA/CpsF family glycosyltransferase [Verrucomicrobiota bacterium]